MVSGSNASIPTGMTGQRSAAAILLWTAGCRRTRWPTTGGPVWPSRWPVMAVESLAATGGFVPGAVRTFGVVAEGVELGSVPVPAILQSRLGVDQRWQRRGLGASLMWHALGIATAVAPALRGPARGCPRREPAAGFLAGSGSGPSTATRDGATWGCGTLRPPSRLEPLNRREPPSQDRPTPDC